MSLSDMWAAYVEWHHTVFEPYSDAALAVLWANFVRNMGL